MKAVRNALLGLLATTALLGASACLSESDGSNLNPQPLPPATAEPPPPEGAGGSDRNGATGAGGAMDTPNNPAPSAVDAGAPDGSRKGDQRLRALLRDRDTN